jgi:hypothetical protein
LYVAGLVLASLKKNFMHTHSFLTYISDEMQSAKGTEHNLSSPAFSSS